MSFLFGKQKTPKEVLREHQRALNSAMREIDRERVALQNQEKKTIIEVKNLAKKGQLAAAKIMAKDLVRTRQYVQKFYKMHAELQAVSLRIVTLKSTASMTEAMVGVTRAMASMNRQMNLPQIQRIMMEFQKQSEIMDMKEEMVSDTMESGMDDAEGESDEVVNQIMEEIGIDLSGQLGVAPVGMAAAPQKAPDTQINSLEV
eukprot:TRINITY_DN5993_c2_g1_i2.p1 TRINITY_DN5993_c2_g1~~TRINITY_DN5993_c2_g1_i2.p1  ORF type:complete len:214 (+),score=43.25 TRINITY_DN5993_c2_g1_i2:37-642(+)